MTKHMLIIGGTGQIGRTVAHEFVLRGWKVTVTHRGSHALPQELAVLGVEDVIMDRDRRPEVLKKICTGADAVVDTIAYDARHATQLLEIQNNVGAFVVISSSSVYCDARGRTLDEARENGFPDLPKPIKETQQTVAPGDQTYSTKKIGMERTLLDRASKPVVILRPCAIHGVGSTHPREWWFVKRMMDRRPFIPLAYRGESRFHTSAAKNIAALIGIVLENPRTRILNVADKTAFSLIEIGRAIAHHLHYSGRFVPVNDDGYPPAIGATPWSVPAPFTLDNGAAIALGYAPFAYDETVGPVCDWLMRTGGTSDWKSRFPVLASYPYEQFDYAAENEYLARSYRD